MCVTHSPLRIIRPARTAAADLAIALSITPRMASFGNKNSPCCERGGSPNLLWYPHQFNMPILLSLCTSNVVIAVPP